MHNITSVKGLFISGFMGFDRPAYKDSVRHYHQGQQLEDLKKEHIIQSRGEWEGSAIVKVTQTVYIFCTIERTWGDTVFAFEIGGRTKKRRRKT